jgi:hypothetical protein
MPATPTGLSATPGDAEVFLAWTANTVGETTTYQVYRSDDGGSSFNFIGSPRIQRQWLSIAFDLATGATFPPRSSGYDVPAATTAARRRRAAPSATGPLRSTPERLAALRVDQEHRHVRQRFEFLTCRVSLHELAQLLFQN